MKSSIAGLILRISGLLFGFEGLGCSLDSHFLIHYQVWLHVLYYLGLTAG